MLQHQDTTTEPRPSRRATRLGYLLGLLIVAVAAGFAGGLGSFAAFTGTTSNTGNKISSGTVALVDNDGGSGAFTVSGLVPSSTQSKCIRVTSQGSFDSHVRSYASSGGSGLAPYVGVRVTRGTQSSPSFPNCSGFTADTTDYLGNGNGVVYVGTLADMPSSWASGIIDAPGTGAAENWTTNESHDYKIDLAVGDNRSAEGKSASATFTWEARDGSRYASRLKSTSGLAGYWRLGESSGTTAVDQSSYSNNGAYAGSYVLGATGALTADPDTATTFNRAGAGRVEIPDSASLAFGDSLTWEAWVKRSSFGAQGGNGQFQTILNKGDGGANLSFTDDNYLRFTKPPSNPIVASTIRILDSSWHHVVATKSGASSKLYIDGVDRTGTVTDATLANTTAPLSIGRRPGFTQDFDGSIDEVAVYTRALSADEIKSHYNEGTN